jgi:hypothetical protein
MENNPYDLSLPWIPKQDQRDPRSGSNTALSIAATARALCIYYKLWSIQAATTQAEQSITACLFNIYAHAQSTGTSISALA